MGRHIRDSVTTLDYIKQPLPLVGAFVNYANTAGLFVYDSDGINVATKNAGNLGPTSYSEFYSTTVNQTGNGTNQQLTTSQVTAANFNFGTKATMGQGADGNAYMWGSPDGEWGAKNANVVPSNQAYWGVIIGPEGYRPNFSLFHLGTQLRQMARGGNLIFDQYTIQAADAVLAGSTTTLNGVANAANTQAQNAAAGMVAYHRVLSKLVIMELRDNGSNYRVHVWKNPLRQLTGRLGEIGRFIREAKAGTNGASYNYYDVTLTAGSGGLVEPAVRCRLVPSNTDDTRYTLVRMWPSNFVETQVLTQGPNNTMTINLRQTSAALTTSYGCESGAMYGIRHQVSWDNKWLVAYSGYYYYGCGMSGYVISLDDPTVTYTISESNSADGTQILPYERSGFLVNRSAVNTDGGSGLTTAFIDPGSGYQAGGLIPLTNQATITMNFTNSQFDVGYTSTSYGALVSIDRWILPAGGNANG